MQRKDRKTTRCNVDDLPTPKQRHELPDELKASANRSYLADMRRLYENVRSPRPVEFTDEDYRQPGNGDE